MAAKISAGLGLEHSALQSPYFIAIIIILLVCFSGRNSCQTRRRQMDNLLDQGPYFDSFRGYQLMKKTPFNSMEDLTVIKSFQLYFYLSIRWMIAFHVDTLENGDTIVFVPSAPNVWEDNVIIF